MESFQFVLYNVTAKMILYKVGLNRISKLIPTFRPSQKERKRNVTMNICNIICNQNAITSGTICKRFNEFQTLCIGSSIY